MGSKWQFKIVIEKSHPGSAGAGKVNPRTIGAVPGALGCVAEKEPVDCRIVNGRDTGIGIVDATDKRIDAGVLGNIDRFAVDHHGKISCNAKLTCQRRFVIAGRSNLFRGSGINTAGQLFHCQLMRQFLRTGSYCGGRNRFICIICFQGG